jgi:WD40 repeat protein
MLRVLEIPEYQIGQGSQCDVDFSPDGRMLVGACGISPVSVWKVYSGHVLYSLYDAPQHIITCRFTDVGDVIACGGFDKEITLWDSSTGEKISTFDEPNAPIWDIEFTLDGDHLLSCSLGLMGRSSGGGAVSMWQVSDKEILWNYDYINDFLSIAVHPGGAMFVYGGLRGKIGLMDVSNGDLILELTDTTKNIGDLTFSPSGDLLVAGSDDDQIYIWETTSYPLSSVLRGHGGYVNGVAVNPPETILVSGSHDETLGIWNFTDHNLISFLQGHENAVLRVALNANGNLIASISWDGTVRLWGVASE